jgi:predicted  nucleic acid-binding Zn ribbon protein
MLIARITSARSETGDLDQQSHAVNELLGVLRMDGHVLGREFPIAVEPGQVTVTVLIPDWDALEPSTYNDYCRGSLAGFAAAGLDAPAFTILGRDIDGGDPCDCPVRSSLILYTTYLALGPPAWCGDCFGYVPLYRLPRLYYGEQFPLICWQSDYQACDTLQMNCRTGERFGLRQLGDLQSSLSRRGRDIAQALSDITGCPVYYYLYRHGARSRAAELRRQCPACGGDWRLPRLWHDLFDFRCDACRLLSNIAWDVR